MKISVDNIFAAVLFDFDEFFNEREQIEGELQYYSSKGRKREARDNFYPLTAYLSLFVGGLVLAGY